MKILIIGGTGFISGFLANDLVDAGHTVTLFTRGTSQNPFLKKDLVTFIFGDRRDESALAGAFEHKTYDAVYDIIAYEPGESASAAKVCKGKTGRFIHCSTISVYMVSDKVRCPITEDQDTLPLMNFWARNPFGMEYGIQKRKCEDILWRAHDEKTFPVSMLRPTFVSGPYDPGRRDWFWIQRILDGGPLLVPGTGDFPFQNVYIKDVSRAFSDLLKYEESIGQAYTIASEEIFSLNDYLKSLSELIGVDAEIHHIDQELFDTLSISINPGADVFPYNTRRTTIFDLSKIKRDLNYRSTPFNDWMRITAEWFTRIFKKNSPGYERRGEELRIIDRLKKEKSNYLNRLEAILTEG
jgi:nucleoside-diphosphate-sugar epimerase